MKRNVQQLGEPITLCILMHSNVYIYIIIQILHVCMYGPHYYVSSELVSETHGHDGGCLTELPSLQTCRSPQYSCSNCKHSGSQTCCSAKLICHTSGSLPSSFMVSSSLSYALKTPKNCQSNSSILLVIYSNWNKQKLFIDLLGTLKSLWHIIPNGIPFN